MTEQMIVIAGRFAVCCLIFYMAYIFFRSIFTPKSGLCYNVMSILSPVLVFYVNTFNSTVINALSSPFILLTFAYLMFDISISNAVSYTIVFFVVFSGGKEVVFVLLNRLLEGMYPDVYRMLEGPGGVYILVVEQFLGYLILLYTLRYTSGLKIGRDNHFSWNLLVIPATSMFILSSFLYMDFPESRNIQLQICIGGFLLYFSNIAVFVIISKHSILMEKAKLAEMYKLKSDLETESFKKQDESTRRILHDNRKRYNNLRMLALNGETEKIVEVINDYEGKMYQESKGITYSLNPVMNAILMEREMEAKELGIELDMHSEPNLNVDFMELGDMVSLFGNLLDNALEAAAGCDPGGRQVSVRLYLVNKFKLGLHIENTFQGSSRKEGSRYLTTKADKRAHGLGIGICGMLTDKYGGTLELNEDGGKFETTLILPTKRLDA